MDLHTVRSSHMGICDTILKSCWKVIPVLIKTFLLLHPVFIVVSWGCICCYLKESHVKRQEAFVMLLNYIHGVAHYKQQISVLNFFSVLCPGKIMECDHWEAIVDLAAQTAPTLLVPTEWIWLSSHQRPFWQSPLVVHHYCCVKRSIQTKQFACLWTTGVILEYSQVSMHSMDWIGIVMDCVLCFLRTHSKLCHFIWNLPDDNLLWWQ